MIEAIFFDFDGVIVESADIKTNAFARLFESEGDDVVNKVVDYHLNNAGVSRFDKFRYIYGEILKRPLADEEFTSLCDRFARLVMESVVNAPYVKGAKEFLENYASAFICFVVSATPQQEIEEILRRRNIEHFFKYIFGAPNKKADSVRDILAREGVKPCDAVYIGDAFSDYEAAEKNLVHFVARINENEFIFKKMNCTKIKDLTDFRMVLDTFGS